MARPARILVVEDAARPEALVGEGLRGHGYEPVTVAPEAIGELQDLAGQRPDVVLLNLASRAARDTPEGWLGAADTLSRLAADAHIPALLVGEPADLIGQALAGAWDDTLPLPASAGFIASRIATLLRLNTMRAELNRRMATCARYGLDAPLSLTRPQDVADAAILVLSQGAEFGAIDQALGREAAIVGAFTSATAADYLATRPFDAVVMDASVGPDPVFDFVAELRLNPRHFNLPLLLAGAPMGADWLDEAFGAGVTEILPAPLDASLLRQRAMALVAESRFRETLKSTYRQARHMATGDALTGLYSRGFLMEHLKSLLAPGAFRPFSVAGLRIRDMEKLNAAHGYAVGDRVIRQVADMMGLMTRGEDLVARHGGARFVIVLTDTSLEAADTAVQRLDAVIAFTDIAIEGMDEPVRVSLEGGVTPAAEAQTPEALVAKAFGRRIAPGL